MRTHLEKNPISEEIICRAGTNVVGKAWLWLEMRREGDVRGDLDEEHIVVVVKVVVEVVVDVVVEVEVDVDDEVLGIETGLLADEDRGGDNLERTDLVIFSPGR